MLTDNLVGYWKLDGDAADSINGSNGTASNVSYVAGKINQAASFNGSSSYISLPDLTYGMAANFTIAAWIKTSASGAANGYQILSRDKVGTARYFQFRVDSDGKVRLVRFDVGNNSVSNFASTGTVNNNAWHFVAATFDSAVGSKIYIDGSQDGSDSATSLNHDGTGGCIPTIGCDLNNAGSYGDFFSGLIDSVSLFSRTLSAAEIAQLYNGGSGYELPVTLATGLVSHWELDGNANDSVASNNGTSTSITYSAGILGQAASFDGSNSQIAYATTPVTGRSNFTICAWAKFTSDADYSSVIAMGGTGTNGSVAISRWTGAGGTIRASFYGGGGIVDSGVVGSLNTWYHIALVGNAATGTLSLYVNGSYKAVGGAVAYNITGNEANVIGRYAAGGDNWTMNGLISKVGVYSRQLSANEIATLYNAGRALAYPLATDLATGLFSYHRLDGNGNDSIGSNHGTASNVTYASGKFGQAASFNGSSSCITTPWLVTPNGSISAWIKTSQATAGEIWGNETTGQYHRLNLNSVAGKATFYVYTAGAEKVNITSTTTVNDNAWHHIVAIWGTGGAKLYVDGNLEASSDDTSYGNSAQGLNIGRNYNNGSPVWYFSGLIDEVCFYSKALSSSEIAQLYAVPLGYFSIFNIGFQAKLDQQSGTSAAIDCGMEANRAVLVSVMRRNGSTISATCGGQAMTLLGSLASAWSAGDTTFLFGISNPPTGSQTVEITHNGSLVRWTAASYASDKALAFADFTTHQSASAAAQSISVTPANANSWILGGGWINVSTTLMPASGTVLRTTANSSANYDSGRPVSSAYSLGYTESIAGDLVAAALYNAAASAFVPRIMFL